jgi:DNA polymerase-3 subunit alpha
VLEDHKEGLVILTACAAGQIFQECFHNNRARATQLAKMLKEIFKDDFYLEIQDTDLTLINNQGVPRHQKEVNKEIIEMAEELGIKCIATGDAHYLYVEDSGAHEVALAIATAARMTDPKKSEAEALGIKEEGVRYRMAFKDREYYVKSRDEMATRFEDKYLDNSLEVLSKCCHKNKDNTWESNVHINMPSVNKEDKYLMPKFPVEDSKKLFMEKVAEGRNKRYKNSEFTDKQIDDRLVYEISIITKMQFYDYFLIISDMLSWARSRGIAVGAGRGSAAGSLICYCLEITDVCPFEYGLLFERG